MDVAAVEDIILGLLAEDAGVVADELRAELLAGGAQMPIDSLLAVEVLVRVQNRVGVVVPATEDTALAMRSVHSFAAAVVRRLGDRRAHPVSA